MRSIAALGTAPILVLLLSGAAHAGQSNGAPVPKDETTAIVGIVTVDGRKPIAGATVVIASTRRGGPIEFRRRRKRTASTVLPRRPATTSSGSWPTAIGTRSGRWSSPSGGSSHSFSLREREFMFRLGSRTGVDLTLVQFGSYLFFDVGDDEEGEVDLYQDGKLGAAVQMAGLDFVLFTNESRRARVGINVGVGIATPRQETPKATETASSNQTGASQNISALAAIISTSLFLDLSEHVRFEYGMVWGFSAKDGLIGGQRDDVALFLGLSLKTSLGNELVKRFR